MNLSSVLQWLVMPEDDVVVTKNAEWMACVQYEPRDFESSSREQLIVARRALSDAILHFDKGWCLGFEERKYDNDHYPESSWPDPCSEMIDRQRRATFTAAGAQFTTARYIWALYQPPMATISDIAAHFEHRTAAARDTDGRVSVQYDLFRRGVDKMVDHLSGSLPMIKRIGSDDLLSYLKGSIDLTGRRARVAPFQLFIADYLAHGEDVLGGRKLMIGDHHVRIVRIIDTPERSTPGIIDGFRKLRFPYRRIARWIPLDTGDALAEIDLRKRQWAQKREPFLDKMLKLKRDDNRTNVDADNRATAAQDALAMVNSGTVDFGFWDHKIVVAHQDIHVVNDRVAQIEHILTSKSFPSSVPTDDAMCCWIGSLPGHPHGDLRRMLGPALTFADVAPMTGTWEGPETDEHLGAPLLRCSGDDGTPFNFCLHQPGSDVGHMLIIGQTGAGKSVLVSSMMSAYRKYPRSRIVVFDRGGNSKCMTLALGGTFHSLAADDDAISLQPLRNIDISSELAWAYEWILGWLTHNGRTVTPAQEIEIHSALVNQSTLPHEQRTVSIFQALVQDSAIKIAMTPLCSGGALGDLFDNDHFSLGYDADVVSYETESLLKRPTAIGPVLSCVFHEISRKFNGDPMLLFIEEAWSMLDSPMLSKPLTPWLKTARGSNVQVVMVTQSPEDIAKSSVRGVIAQSCLQRVYCAIETAAERETASMLSELGLSKEKISIISRLRPKAEYVFSVGNQWRKFGLSLTKEELALTGSKIPADLRKMDEILNDGPRSEFYKRWMEQR